MLSDIEFERQLKREFLSEAEEIIQKFEDVLLQLKPGSDNASKMNELFRYAHTLKGSGLAAGFTQFGHFAHKIENLLDAIRAHKIAVSRANTDILLAALDALRAYRRNLESDGGAQADFQELETRILEIMGKPTSAEDLRRQPPLQVSPRSFSLDFDHELIPLVYVCEDDDATRELIERSLPRNWRVEGFVSGEAFMLRFQQEPAHLVITDLRLPGMDGNQVIEQVKNIAPRTPVIVISGLAERSDVINFLAVGAFAFLEKPFDESDLRQTCDRALREWIYRQTLDEITVLSFRTFMNFSSIVQLIPHEQLDATQTKTLENFESKLTRIGSLCSRANRFARQPSKKE